VTFRKRTLLALALLTFVALAAAAARLSFLMNSPVVLATQREVEVGRGESPASVARRLERDGIVRNARVLLLLARMRSMDRDIRYGTHTFTGSMTPADVLAELVEPPRPTVRVTIPEGLTWDEIATLLEAQAIVSADDYRRAVCDPDLLLRLAVPSGANCAEGYLFPDTYDLAPDMSAAEIVALQVLHFERVIDRLLPAPADGSFEPAVATPQAERIANTVILASIIEAEAKVAEERALIASVFHNRLRRGIRLQADPTAIYGMHAAGEKWDGTRLHERLRVPGPYNTYTNAGLPPGPICNPGRQALRAALEPAETKFLYFVARGDGSHQFSATLAEHNRAVAQLRRR
jgi:UPF0755 protein